MRQAELREFTAARAGDELLANSPNDRCTIVCGDWRIETKTAIGARRTSVPTGPYEGEDTPHGQRIPQIGRSLRLVPHLARAKIGKQHDAPAVVHFVEDAAITILRINRT